MGKKIDLFVLTLAAAGGLYIYFRGALQNSAAALFLALLCCFTLTKFLRRAISRLSQGRLAQKLRVRKCASGAVMALACGEAEETRKKLLALLRTSYSGERQGDYSVALIQLHPSTKLPQERLFDAWLAHRGEHQLAVCATCIADADCRILASSLRAPRVALMDASNLAQLIAAHPEEFGCEETAGAKPRRFRLRRAASLIINRKNAPRGLVFTGAMVLMYVFSANIAYLIAAMALLFLVLVSLHRTPAPAKLF